MTNNLLSTFGNIDIYLFDQLLKGSFDACKTILDIGCGGGRNIHYFLKNGFVVHGVDLNPEAIVSVKELAQQLAPQIPSGNFIVARADELPYGDDTFDLVISSAVLHFANNTDHFEQMLYEAWRVLRPGGFFFARLASDIGIEGLVGSIGNGRYLLPDGSERYLVTYDDLVYYTRELNGELFEPIKTTNVSNLRAMTTWCMAKR
ncbi:class I SAM-dependent methyltransferase [Flavipsychrobacter stenotrophus]|uniref:Class I SAM-dependent methyltransferase n=1 Tax=Flavipsychrobacter stenotrophus TaxID=2077091 RepID=A0A2S7SY37_9BACT|nr:class I SAM-dependent methyltransferase [Flavipsychrobacter stenotrophus]PQJ11829.1 class I SAM-dependent methyltransferase [Flavipsychrobacter stenotrophus]